jgi:hypothetical protein
LCSDLIINLKPAGDVIAKKPKNKICFSLVLAGSLAFLWSEALRILVDSAPEFLDNEAIGCSG